jgi:hypothetical protein
MLIFVVCEKQDMKLKISMKSQKMEVCVFSIASKLKNIFIFQKQNIQNM